MIQSFQPLTKHHSPPSAVLIEIVHCPLPDRDPKDSYGGAPSKNHSGEDVAILPNGHKSGSSFPRYHEEQAANNDLQRCRSIQESWQPVAQPCALFALYRAKGDGTEMSLIDELVFNKNPLWAEA